MPVLDLQALTQPTLQIGNGSSASSLDPSIPADLTRSTAPLVSGSTLPPASATGSNPLGMIGDFASVQAQMNQNKLFAQTYKARQKAGQIMASAPNIDAGIQGMLADPDVAPFAGETISAMRQAQQTLVATQGEQQTQAQSGLAALLKSMPAVMADPSTWNGVVNSNLATLSPSAKAAVVPAISSIKSALLDDLPSDQKQAQSLFNQRLAGMMLGAGITPDQIQGIVGKPTSVNAGGRTVFGTQAPAQQGGGFNPSGQSVVNSLAPQTVTGPYGPGGATATRVIGGGGSGVPGPLGNGVSRPSNGPNSTTSPPPNALGGTGMIGPSQSQSEYNTDRAKDIADYEKSLDDRVQNGGTLRKNVAEVVDAAKSASTGGGAETYAKLGSALQAIGVQNPTVDHWANGSLASSQIIDKVALQNSMSQLKQQLTGVGGSRLNAQEFVAYLNKNPNLTTDPRAAMQIFNLWNQFYDRDKTEQAAFDKFKAGKPTGDKSLDSAAGGNSDLTRWPALWNQSDYMTKFAPGGAISSAGVKGTNVPAGVTHHWDAALGKIVPGPAPAGGQ